MLIHNPYAVIARNISPARGFTIMVRHQTTTEIHCTSTRSYVVGLLAAGTWTGDVPCSERPVYAFVRIDIHYLVNVAKFKSKLANYIDNSINMR